MPPMMLAIRRTPLAAVVLIAGCGGAPDLAAANTTEAPAASSSTRDAAAVPVAVAPPAVAAAGDADRITGRFTYEFSGGANAAGTDTIVTYTLILTPSSCRLTAEGYQTDETIVCGTSPVPGGVDVTFRSYGDGRLTDRYDNVVYSVGDPLFSLRRQGGKVLTRWKGYPLPDEKPHPEGAYFTQ